MFGIRQDSLLLILLVGLFFSACTATLIPLPPSMANPASQHREAAGGKLKILEHDSGGQYGVCQFEDGSECEERALLRGDCVPGGSR